MVNRLTAAAGLLLTLLLALSFASGCGGESADGFVGSWRETGASAAYKMQIAASEDGLFTVTYRRFYPYPSKFELRDGKLTYSAVTPDMADVITYDAGDDTVTITSGSSGDSYTLARVNP